MAKAPYHPLTVKCLSTLVNRNVFLSIQTLCRSFKGETGTSLPYLLQQNYPLLPIVFHVESGVRCRLEDATFLSAPGARALTVDLCQHLLCVECAGR